MANDDVVIYADVTLATLVRGEPARTRAFISSRVGRLDAEEKTLLRAYLAARGSPTRAAAATYSHRNTVLERIRRMESRLGAPLRGGELELALALELDRFYGPGQPPGRPGAAAAQEPSHPPLSRS
ncbi:MAG TPA: helix-turn-helix domain-containing protein [Solirubrobacteraceae bacterium]|nr:helix-turn-helix domain-containing protein [Solirubrobacteraceae bacterium]